MDGRSPRLDRTGPGWTVRRLVREDNERICSLSRWANLPDSLDDTIDAHHEILPLAILLAFIQVRHAAKAAPSSVSSAPEVVPAPTEVMCCDNFA
jgi:hypothetical protein